jgi:hypothetical protein
MDKPKNPQSHFDIFSDPTLSERVKYKYFTKNDTDIIKLKEKVKNIVAKKGLSSRMNDTKWLELQSAITQLPFPPPYVEKLVLENKTYEEVKISDSPQWYGDWSPFYYEGMYWFFAIEYIKVRPFHMEYIGRLVDGKIRDETEAFEKILKVLHIPYEEENGTFIIYGYK